MYQIAGREYTIIWRSKMNRKEMGSSICELKESAFTLVQQTHQWLVSEYRVHLVEIFESIKNLFLLTKCCDFFFTVCDSLGLNGT